MDWQVWWVLDRKGKVRFVWQARSALEGLGGVECGLAGESRKGWAWSERKGRYG